MLVFFPSLSVILYVTLYLPTFAVFTFPFTLTFASLAVNSFPAESLIKTKSFTLTFEPSLTVAVLAVIVGLFPLNGFFGSGSVGSHEVRDFVESGVNDGLPNGSSFFVPLKITYRKSW